MRNAQTLIELCILGGCAATGCGSSPADPEPASTEAPGALASERPATAPPAAPESPRVAPEGIGCAACKSVCAIPHNEKNCLTCERICLP